MTWLQLWKKIGKQPLKRTQNRKVTIYHNGMIYEAEMRYTNNGNYFYLETSKDAIGEIESQR